MGDCRTGRQRRDRHEHLRSRRGRRHRSLRQSARSVHDGRAGQQRDRDDLLPHRQRLQLGYRRHAPHGPVARLRIVRPHAEAGRRLRHGQRPLSHHGIYERRPDAADHRSRIGIQRDGILDLHASDLRRPAGQHLHDVPEPRTALLHQRAVERLRMAQRQREQGRRPTLHRR